MSAAVVQTIAGVTAVVASIAAGPQGPAGPAVSVGGATAGQFYCVNAADTAAVWVSASGDVSASAVTPGQMTVVGLQGRAIASTSPASGQALVWSGSMWAPSSTVAGVAPGTSGQVYITNGTPASAWTSLIQVTEFTHGRFQVGGAGSDLKVVIGPLVGSETGNAGVYCLATATAPTTTNWSFQGDGTNSYISAPSGAVYFYNAGSLQIGLWNGTALYINNGFVGLNGSGATYGTLGQIRHSGAGNIIGGYSGAATYVAMSEDNAEGLYIGCQSSSATSMYGYTYLGGTSGVAVLNSSFVTNFFLSNTNNIAYFGGAVGSAPAEVDWSTSTTPWIHSGTSATQLTVGTNKASASLLLAADANQTFFTLANNGITLGFGAANAAAGAAFNINGQNAGGTNDGGPIVLTGGSHAGSGTVDGSVKIATPCNIGELTYTPAAAAISFTQAQSDANILLLNGAYGNPYTITYQRRIADTSFLIVRNASAQTATIQFLTGGSVSLAASTSAVIVSDGTNLQKIVIGT